MTDTTAKTTNPWLWVPSLYFAQGIPYVIANTVSVIMYKKMGISNTDIALYTSWLNLPWVIKPLWSPIVDLVGTKRRWVVGMQVVIGALLACVALTLPLSSFFQYSLAVLWLIAFSSATHDIAADGFYMFGLSQHHQAAFVGVRSTFYRIAMISGQGLLVILAGQIESRSGLEPVVLPVNVVAADAAVSQPSAASITAASSEGTMRLTAEPAEIAISAVARSKAEVDAVVKASREHNIRNGFREEEAATTQKAEGPSWWRRNVADKLAGFLRQHFGEVREKIDRSGNVGVCSFRLTQKPEAGRTVAVLLSQISGDPGIGVVEGARLVFSEKNWDVPARVVFQIDPKLKTATSSVFRATSGNIVVAWTTVFFILAVVFTLFCVYHKFALPHPEADRPGAAGGKKLGSEFIRTFSLFFKKKEILTIIAFLLFYRFAEAQIIKLLSPFLLDSREVGGLGLTTAQVGLAYGTVGIACLMSGGILGGYVISRKGLRFWLWPMVVIINMPALVYILLSYTRPENLYMICAAVGLEQFGYGFGFTAYMLFMILASQGEHKTAHYALCTGFMALSMMIPGMFSGWLQEIIGYQHFFIWVLISTIPGFIAASMVKVDPEFGRKK